MDVSAVSTAEPHERSYGASPLVTGALVISTTVSLFACAFIGYTYLRWRRLRRHPSSLILSRVCMDALFCAELLASHLFTRTNMNAAGGEASMLAACQPFAFISQFACLGAELYFACLSLDLVLSTSNPFTDYRWNVVRYHVAVLLLSAATGMALLMAGENGRPMYGYDNFLSICWVRNYNESGGMDPAFYSFFVAPTAGIYIASALTLVYASRRLQQGLPETFEARLDMYRMSFRFVTMYLLYWCLSFGVFCITTLVDAAAPPDILSLLVALALGGRGVVALLVWLLTYGRNLRCSRKGLIILGESTSSSSPATTLSAAAMMDAVADLRPFLNTALRKEILYYATIGIARSVLRAKRSKEHKPDGYTPARGGSRFSPVVGGSGSATRRDIAYNVLMLSRRKEEVGLFDLEAKQMRARRDSLAAAGGRQSSPEHQPEPSVARGGLLTPLLSFMGTEEHEGIPALDLRGSLSHALPHSPSGVDTSRESPPAAATRVYGSWPTFIANALCGPADAAPRFRFIDYEPWLFRTLRVLNGIDETDYIRSLSRTKREKFGEGGASGAFLYFSADERFIVKTLTRAECDTLCAMLHDYALYMTSHPHALITRFYGAHELHMYGTVLYLVVMANVLTTGGTPSLTLHERYDLKGSWIARHRTPIERGQRVECRYCGQTFRAGGGDRFGGGACPERPNRPHEANTVLKDNDLTVKLRLTRDCAQALGDQISADTEFLRRHGITDYSLLLGIHRTKYKLISGGHAGPGVGSDGLETPAITAGVPTPFTGASLPSTTAVTSPLAMPSAAVAASAATRGALAMTGIAGAITSSPPVVDVTAALMSASAPLTQMPTRRAVVSTPTGQDGFMPSRSAPQTRPPRSGVQSAPVPVPLQLPASLGDARWGFDTGGELASSPAVPAPIAATMDVEAGLLLAPSSPAASSRIVTGIPIASPDIAPMRSLGMHAGEEEAASGTAAMAIPRRSGNGRTSRTRGAAHIPGSAGGFSASSDTLLTTLQRHRVAQAAAAAAGSDALPDVSGSAPHSLPLIHGPPVPIREARASITIADEEDASGGVYEEDEQQPAQKLRPPAPPVRNAAVQLARAVTDATECGAPAGRGEAVRLQRAASAHDVWASSPGRGDGAPTSDTFGAPVLRLHEPARANAVRRVLEASAASVEDEEDVHSRGSAPLQSVDPFFRAYRGGLRSTIVEGPGIYYMGIIDVLQTYTLSKRLERWMKIYFACANGRGLSVMPPDEYAARFRTRVIGQLIDGYQHREYVWDDEFGDM